MQCRLLESMPGASRGPLWGIPFAVKDNIDVAGLPTTAACEAFKYHPSESAPTVQALLDAGELLSTLYTPSTTFARRMHLPFALESHRNLEGSWQLIMSVSC